MIDEKSLERMVVEYVQDQHLVSTAELDQLTEEVRRGNLTIIMKQYERDLKTPFKSVFGGDIVRLVLIQIQKTKVDLEIAMQALDKLLRSNELNFAFLAVMPTLLIIGAGWHTLSSWLDRQKFQSTDQQMALVRHSLR